MSSEYTLLFRGSTVAVLFRIERILGVIFPSPATGSRDGIRHAEVVGVALTFQPAHELDDDLGIPFRQYDGAVSFSRSAAQDEPTLREALCRTLALLCGAILARTGDADTMVVRDGQEIIARAGTA